MRICYSSYSVFGPCGGEGGIRTHDTVARMPHFECGAFDHSATSPGNLVGATCARRLIATNRKAGKGRNRLISQKQYWPSESDVFEQSQDGPLDLPRFPALRVQSEPAAAFGGDL